MASKFVEKQDELTAARKAAKELFDQYPDVGEMPDEVREQAKQLNAKMADLHDQVTDLQAIEAMRARATEQPQSAGRQVPVEGTASSPSAKSWDIESALRSNTGYMELVGRKAQVSGRKGFSLPLFEVPGTFKTLVTLTQINNPATRNPAIVNSAVDETTVGDLMLQGTTDNNTLTYIEETTFTNAAATVAEGGTKPESAWAGTERTDNVRKIATWIPVTDELLSDVAGFRSYIEGRLRFMVEREEEDQLLNGDGTAPNISGILDRSIQTVGSTNDIDAFYAAITEVRVDGQAEPTAAVVHPYSWQKIRLTKDSTGQYLGPGPFSNDPGERLWGLPVRVTPLIAEGTALVGAFRPYAQIFRREGITVTASTEHASYFIENKIAILAEERLALAVYRPAAFCSITGLASS